MKRYKKFLFAALLSLFIGCTKDSLPESTLTLFQVEDVSATAGDEAVTLQWTAPENGAPQSYYLTWVADSSLIEGGEMEIEAGQTSQVIEGLVNEIKYTFSMQARYSGGLSHMISASTTPKSSRFDVSSLAAIVGDRTVRLTWIKPASEALTGYKLIVNDGTIETTETLSDLTIERYTIKELQNGVSYTFTLIATYTNGDSEGESVEASPGELQPITMQPEAPVVFQPIAFAYNELYFIDGDVVSAEWDFGDGSTSNKTNAMHTYLIAGDYTLTITVTYADNSTASATRQITVANYAWSQIDLLNGSYQGFVKSSNPVFSPDGSTIYMPTSNKQGDLFAIDAYTGAIKWVFPLAKSTYGGGAAVGADGVIYQGDQNKTMFAINTDGTQKWSLTLDGNIEAFPALTSEGMLYVGTNGSKLYAINAGDGSIKWERSINGSVASALAVGADGNIYVGTNEMIYSFSAAGDERWTSEAVNVTERGSFAISGSTLYAALKGGAGVIALNMSNGATAWKAKPSSDTSDGYFPIVDTNGAIYYSSKAGNVHAINSDGSAKWSVSAGAALIYMSLALDADGNIYGGTQGKVGENYQIFSINSQTQALSVLASSSDSSLRVMSSMVVGADKRLYFGTLGAKLSTVELSAAAMSGSWSMRGANLQGTNSLK